MPVFPMDYFIQVNFRYRSLLSFLSRTLVSDFPIIARRLIEKVTLMVLVIRFH